MHHSGRARRVSQVGERSEHGGKCGPTHGPTEHWLTEQARSTAAADPFEAATAGVEPGQINTASIAAREARATARTRTGPLISAH